MAKVSILSFKVSQVANTFETMHRLQIALQRCRKLTYDVSNGRGVLTSQKFRVEVDHDDPPVEGKFPERLILNISGGVAKRMCWRVTEDDGGLRDLQGVMHGVYWYVREVYYHT